MLTLKLYPNVYIMYNIQDPAFTHQHYGLSFPGGSDGKESACNAEDLGSIPGWGISPGGRHGNPIQYSCLENPHGERSLAGCSPWGWKELDTTERWSTALWIANCLKHSLSLVSSLLSHILPIVDDSFPFPYSSYLVFVLPQSMQTYPLLHLPVLNLNLIFMSISYTGLRILQRKNFGFRVIFFS